MRKQGNFITEALSVKFLLSPFRLVITILFIIGFLFVSSVISQSWFHQPALLEQELAYTQIVFSEKAGDTDFHILFVRYCYNFLYFIFFNV